MDTNMRGLSSGQPSRNPPPSGDVADQIDALKSEFAELAGKVASVAKGQVGEFKSMAAEKEHELRHMIARKPMQATFIAAGVGFVMGLLLTR